MLLCENNETNRREICSLFRITENRTILKTANKFTKSENKSIPHVKEYKKENNDDMNINMNI